ncbi:MAG: HAMP domain-containing protein [Proteobacteria bacterium]|nr:HAMP domain-containing protein [Pseudomonadota bacterium]
MRHPSLARRYAWQIGLVALTLLLAQGAWEMAFGWHEARNQVAQMQAVQAHAAAREMRQHLAALEAALADATKLAPDDLAQRREEFYRLMVLHPLVTDLQAVDAGGRERLFVSRTEPDRVGAGTPVAAVPTLSAHYGDTFYKEGSEPFVRLTVPEPRRPGAVTVATVSLRFLGDVLAGMALGDAGSAYVVDARNRLVAHPRATQALRQLDLAGHPPVQAARASGLAAADTVDFAQQAVIATAVPAGPPGWLLVVEQPRAAALAPVWATLARTLALTVVGVLLAMAAAWVFSRRMAAPIVRLRHATQQVAAGDLAQRIEANGGDEVAALAGDFNRMAAELRASYAGLEAKVSARTAELAQRQEEADRASAAKTRFLAAASHDLRQPMHSIGLLVGVLRQQLMDAGQQQLADKVLRAVTGMEHLFASLLDISKLDAGAVQTAPVVFPLADVLRALDAAYAPQAAARGLRWRVAPCRAVVYSDPALLERLLGNLVANALRYTRQGGVLVGCRRRAGGRLAVQVLDTGVGIAPEQMGHVFEEFVRLPAGEANPGGADAQGLGLGLAIVRRTAALLGHTLHARSLPGRGSVFEIELPLAAGPMASGPALPAPDATRLAGAFVLVVDDDAANRHALHALALHWGCHALAVAGRAEALAALQGHLRTPDLVITDYRLAGSETGFDVLAAVRAATGEATPALVVTADVAADLPARAAAAQATLLHKPASAERIQQAVLALLG